VCGALHFRSSIPLIGDGDGGDDACALYEHAAWRCDPQEPVLPWSKPQLGPRKLKSQTMPEEMPTAFSASYSRSFPPMFCLN